MLLYPIKYLLNVNITSVLWQGAFYFTLLTFMSLGPVQRMLKRKWINQFAMKYFLERLSTQLFLIYAKQYLPSNNNYFCFQHDTDISFVSFL